MRTWRNASSSGTGITGTGTARSTPIAKSDNPVSYCCAVPKALKYTQIDIQYRAVMACSRIPDLQEALPDVLRIAKTSISTDVRKEAIRSAAALVDEKSKPTVLKALKELRFDKNDEIRKEVEDALSKLNEK